MDGDVVQLKMEQPMLSGLIGQQLKDSTYKMQSKFKTTTRQFKSCCNKINEGEYQIKYEMQ